MKKDAQNLNVSTDSEDVIQAIDHFIFQLISSGKDAGAIIDAAANHPNNLLIQCYAAILNLYAQEDQYTVKALPYLENAEKLLMSANQREKMTYQAVVAWKNLDYELVITLFEVIIRIMATRLRGSQNG